MKEIFEKIVIDSASNIANSIVNEISTKKNDSSSLNNKDIKFKDSPDNESKVQKTPNESRNNDQVNSNYSGNIGVINAYSRNRRLNFMIVSAAIGLVFCLIVLTSYNGDLPGEVVGIISTISGIFGACLKDAYSFEFGSSRGSKDKDDKISAAILEKLKK
jgi:hypothetical protein